MVGKKNYYDHFEGMLKKEASIFFTYYDLAD